MSRRNAFEFAFLLPVIWGLVTWSVVGRSIDAQVTADQVRDSIRLGIRYLKSQQDKVRGNWSERVGQPGGVTALCTLAMIEAGEPVNSPSVQKALNYLRGINPQSTYSTSLQTMVFCAAEPEKDRLLIRRNAQWLQAAQITEGGRAGAWSYYAKQKGRHIRGDNSNTQFAMLALHEAEMTGVKVPQIVWQRSLTYWLSCQKENGSWGYYKEADGQPTPGSTGSMTCAGTAALIIASGKLSDGDAKIVNGRIQCCGKQENNNSLEKAMHWLGRTFTRSYNPGGSDRLTKSRSGLFYYLYGIERVGRLSGRRFLGDKKDWYRLGAEMFVDPAVQDKLTGYWKGLGHGEDNEMVATSFALLFLSKGRRPVVISRLKYGFSNAWNSHRASVHKLTRDVEKRWKQKLTWQTIDVRAATVENLLETPVLFISGRDDLKLTKEQKDNLRDYVNQGGFIFAEECCDDPKFDLQFRALLKELFPESSLRLLPPDHAIWYAEAKVDPKYTRPLYGLDACCRTSVVYCARDRVKQLPSLSCNWELSQGNRETGYPADVKADIEACLRIGANVLTYATNRQLKDKLDRPTISTNDVVEQISRGALFIPKLTHAGGADDATHSLANILRVVRNQTDMRVSTFPRLLSPADSELYDHPITFIHGRRGFRFSTAERKSLAAYLRRGGFLFGDAICASKQFTDAFRREIKAAIPEANFVRLPDNHPIFSKDLRGFDLSSVTLRDPQARAANGPLKARLTRIKPYLEGVEIDGRLAVIFSPYDISCAMENHASLECKGYAKTDAARISVNVILYALQQ